MFMQPGNIRFELGFRNGQPVRVPAIPAHRRSRGSCRTDEVIPRPIQRLFRLSRIVRHASSWLLGQLAVAYLDYRSTYAKNQHDEIQSQNKIDSDKAASDVKFDREMFTIILERQEELKTSAALRNVLTSIIREMPASDTRNRLVITALSFVPTTKEGDIEIQTQALAYQSAKIKPPTLVFIHPSTAVSLDCANLVAQRLQAIGFVARVEGVHYPITKGIEATHLDYFPNNTEAEAQTVLNQIQTAIGRTLPGRLKSHDKPTPSNNTYGLWLNECNISTLNPTFASD
jgi:hypothetical protein